MSLYNKQIWVLYRPKRKALFLGGWGESTRGWKGNITIHKGIYHAVIVIGEGNIKIDNSFLVLIASQYSLKLPFDTYIK